MRYVGLVLLSAFLAFGLASHVQAQAETVERAGFRAWVSHLAIRDGTQRDGGLAIGNRVGGVKPSRGFESLPLRFFRFRVLGFRY